MKPSPIAFACIDLGSNSFHCHIGQYEPATGEVSSVLTCKEKVALRAGVLADGSLSPAKMTQAKQCLSNFSMHLKQNQVKYTKAIGTYTLRAITNRAEFVRQANLALGAVINVISGLEEAKLIFNGAAASMCSKHHNLLIDIGGGSTEVIIGNNSKTRFLKSFNFGSSSVQSDFFASGKLTAGAFANAVSSVQDQLAHIELTPWQNCLGSGGTVKTIASILAASGEQTSLITKAALQELTERMLSFAQVEAIALPGLRPDRKSILAGGLAVLTAIFASFDIEHMSCSAGGVREGMWAQIIEEIKQQES